MDFEHRHPLPAQPFPRQLTESRRFRPPTALPTLAKTQILAFHKAALDLNQPGAAVVRRPAGEPSRPTLSLVSRPDGDARRQTRRRRPESEDFEGAVSTGRQDARSRLDRAVAPDRLISQSYICKIATPTIRRKRIAPDRPRPGPNDEPNDDEPGHDGLKGSADRSRAPRPGATASPRRWRACSAMRPAPSASRTLSRMA